MTFITSANKDAQTSLKEALLITLHLYLILGRFFHPINFFWYKEFIFPNNNCHHPNLPYANNNFWFKVFASLSLTLSTCIRNSSLYVWNTKSIIIVSYLHTSSIPCIRRFNEWATWWVLRAKKYLIVITRSLNEWDIVLVYCWLWQLLNGSFEFRSVILRSLVGKIMKVNSDVRKRPKQRLDRTNITSLAT